MNHRQFFLCLINFCILELLMFNFQYVLLTDSNCIVVPVFKNKIFLSFAFAVN